jgi:hypothetical protein
MELIHLDQFKSWKLHGFRFFFGLVTGSYEQDGYQGQNNAWHKQLIYFSNIRDSGVGETWSL